MALIEEKKFTWSDDEFRVLSPNEKKDIVLGEEAIIAQLISDGWEENAAIDEASRLLAEARGEKVYEEPSAEDLEEIDMLGKALETAAKKNIDPRTPEQIAEDRKNHKLRARDIRVDDELHSESDEDAIEEDSPTPRKHKKISEDEDEVSDENQPQSTSSSTTTTCTTRTTTTVSTTEYKMLAKPETEEPEPFAVCSEPIEGYLDGEEFSGTVFSNFNAKVDRFREVDDFELNHIHEVTMALDGKVFSPETGKIFGKLNMAKYLKRHAGWRASFLKELEDDDDLLTEEQYIARDLEEKKGEVVPVPSHSKEERTVIIVEDEEVDEHVTKRVKTGKDAEVSVVSIHTTTRKHKTTTSAECEKDEEFEKTVNNLADSKAEQWPELLNFISSFDESAKTPQPSRDFDIDAWKDLSFKCSLRQLRIIREFLKDRISGNAKKAAAGALAIRTFYPEYQF